MKTPENILLIIRRSLGDVLAMSPVIDILSRQFPNVSIDLLVNRDTIAAAKLLNGIRHIIALEDDALKNNLLFSLKMQIGLTRRLFRKYDLAISFTTNERSNLYAYLAGRTAAGAMEPMFAKNWWHRLLLHSGYLINPEKHILENNLTALRGLGMTIERIILSARYPEPSGLKVQKILKDLSVDRFIIFHPAGRFLCKSYPQNLRNRLLYLLDSLNIPIMVTGGKSAIDRQVNASIPDLKNVRSLIGRLSLEECVALTAMSLGYVGVDTFNCHLAAAFNKPVFVMFGPTIPELWSPWSNELQRGGRRGSAIQTYGNITLFQSAKDCVPCGHSKCEKIDRHSACMEAIDPHTVFEAVRHWLSQSQPASNGNAS